MTNAERCKKRRHEHPAAFRKSVDKRHAKHLITAIDAAMVELEELERREHEQTMREAMGDEKPWHADEDI